MLAGRRGPRGYQTCYCGCKWGVGVWDAVYMDTKVLKP